jgi:hypothetical protein
MKTFILICNITVPLLMISIGLLYKYSLYKKTNKILDLFMPIVMIFSGAGDDGKNDFYKNTNLLASANKKCSLIWSISGICTLVITIIVLIVNKSNIINANTFSDMSNVSVIMLEVEFAIVVAVFISVEYFLKKKLYKKIDANLKL